MRDDIISDERKIMKWSTTSIYLFHSHGSEVCLSFPWLLSSTPSRVVGGFKELPTHELEDGWEKQLELFYSLTFKRFSLNPREYFDMEETTEKSKKILVLKITLDPRQHEGSYTA